MGICESRDLSALFFSDQGIADEVRLRLQ